MLSVVVGAIAGLIGVILGGGVRAWEASRARKHDAEALLSSIVAEVEAVTRLINHRQFLPQRMLFREAAMQQVAAGRPNDQAGFLVIDLKKNYFAVFEAATPKLGLLHPYWADRVVRFYTFLKAVTENYHPQSPFQEGVTAEAAVQVFDSDIMLLHTITVLGTHIQSARIAVAPAGVVNPFPQQDGGQPELPTPMPALANAEAAAAPQQD